MQVGNRNRALMVRAFVLGAAVAGFGIQSSALATSDVWTGTAGDGLYVTPGNWTGGNVPGANDGTFVSPDIATISKTPADPADLTATALTNRVITIDDNRNVAGFTYDNIDTASFTIGTSAGPTLHLTSGGTTQIGTNIVNNNTATTQAGITFAIAAPMVVEGNTYTFANNSTQTNTALRPSGTLSFAAAGASALVLDGTNGAGNPQGPSQVWSTLTDGGAGKTLGVTKNGTGAWELAPQGAFNTYSGDTVVNAGALRIRGGLNATTGATTASGASPNSNYYIKSGAKIRFSDTVTINSVAYSADHVMRSVTIDSGGTLETSNAQTWATFSNNSGPAMVLNYTSSTAPSIATRNWKFLGTTNEQGGVKVVANGNTFASFTLGATSTPMDIGTATRPFEIPLGEVLTGSTNMTTAYDFRLRGVVSGTGGIIKTGNGRMRLENTSASAGFWPLTGSIEVREGVLNFSYSNMFAAPVPAIINGGTMHIAGTQSENFSTVTMKKGTIGASSGATSVINTSSVNFDVANGDTATVQTVVADPTAGGSATISKTGAGVGVLSGTNTYTGAATVNAGTLRFTSFARQSFLTSVGGADIKGGRIELDYTGGTSPAATIIPILAANAPTNFAAGLVRSSNATASRGLGWKDDTATSTFTVAAAYKGDANLDGAVNFGDLLVLAANYNTLVGATWSTGDNNYDGAVNFGDLLNLAANYNQTLSGSFSGDWALAQSAVPEPTTLAAAGLLTLGLSRRRR
ncbi:MAG: autotransporter-associated beta strand repeat-containing protein [Tepidisphaeraceae bacterium]